MKPKFIFSLLAVMFLLISAASLQAANIEKGPYLIYEGTNTEMTVLWQLDAAATCTLEWGTDTTYSTGSVQTAEYGTDHQHRYVIPNLSTGTKYYYRVSFSTSSYTGSFQSAPASSAQNLKFFAYGDTRTYPGDQNVVADQMINTYSTDPAFQTLILHVGDWINTDTESDWSEEFFPRSYANIIEMQANLPIQGCIGNHEGSGNVYEKYYPYPYVNSSDFYWSFDYGPIHVAVIDQYTSYSTGSTQYNWLVNDLASTSKKWIFLVFHEPGWSAGGHSNEADVQNYIQPLCTQYGVDIVFCGHNHYYARCVVDDIQHVTTGGGGAPLYSPDDGYPYVVVTSQSNHHCEIDIQGNDLHFTARRDNGSVIDSFTLVDNSGPVTPVADFTANAATIEVGQNVNFTDQSTNTPTSWSWTFQGGTPSSSTAQNPSVTYSAEGTYDVTLTATNAAGSDVETKTAYITVVENLTTYTLTTSVSGEGTVSPSGGTYTEGTVVNIEAVPSAGYIFNGWSGDLSGSTNPTTITMDADKHVNAAFIFSTGGNYLPFPISSSSDDAEEDESDTSMYLDSTDLEMVDESGSSSNRQLVGLRFTGLTIPKGVNITGAYIQFTCDDDNTGSTSLTIKAEDTDNSSTFTTGSGNISSRTTTSASVSWSPPAWTTIGEAGAAQRTPDISSLIQEVIDRPGYSYGNPVTIVITGSGEREAESYDGTAAPVLYIKAESSGPQPPVADFSVNQTTILEGQTVNFTDLSTNAPTSWSWTFDGGTPSSGTTQNPTVTYNTAGIYTVSLTAANAAGSDTETRTAYITVTAPQPPVAGFTASATTVYEGDTVNFTDLSTYNPTSWDWTFTGGTPSSGTTQNPSITYNSEGTYTVSLTVTNAVGSDTETKTNYITVQKAPLVYCSTQGNDYSYEWIENVTVGDIDKTSGAAGYTDFTSITGNLTEGDTVSVSCTPGFSGSTYTEHWKIYIDYNIDGDFADAGEEVFYSISDGTVTGSFVVPSGVEGLTRMRVSMKYDAEQTPCETFTYGEVEDYTVNLIPAAPQPPAADFSASATSVGVGGSVSFTDLSTENPTSWSWTFDGGTPSSSTGQNPTVTYNTAGTYTVSLTATNAAGSDTETKTSYITVTAPQPPVAGFTASTTAIDEGQSVTFTDTSTNDPTSWSWTFDGGTPSSGTAQNPTVTYNTEGTYTVSLTATNSVGSDTETRTGLITVSASQGGEDEIIGEQQVGSQISTSAKLRAQPFTMTENGVIKSVTMYHTGGSGQMILAVYDGETAPNALLSASWRENVSSTTGWQTLDLVSPVYAASGSTVWLAWTYESNPGIAYNSGTPGRAQSDQEWLGTVPTTFVTANQSDFIYSIYATYTPVAGSVGETSRLSSTTTTANRRAMPFTMSENGTIESLSMYHVGSQNSGNDSMILAVYADSGGAPGNKLGQTPVTAVSTNTGWQTIDLQSPVFVSSGTTVWLAWVYESNPGIYYTDGTPGRVDAGVGWSGGMPSVFGSSTQADFIYSIQAIYK